MQGMYQESEFVHLSLGSNRGIMRREYSLLVGFGLEIGRCERSAYSRK